MDNSPPTATKTSGSAWTRCAINASLKNSGILKAPPGKCGIDGPRNWLSPVRQHEPDIGTVAWRDSAGECAADCRSTRPAGADLSARPGLLSRLRAGADHRNRAAGAAIRQL